MIQNQNTLSTPSAKSNAKKDNILFKNIETGNHLNQEYSDKDEDHKTISDNNDYFQEVTKEKCPNKTGI